MNKQSLKKLLEREGFRPDAYDLEGGLLPERLTLAEESGQWYVYYSEHGLQSSKKHITTEDEACEYLLTQLRDEPFAKQ